MKQPNKHQQNPEPNKWQPQQPQKSQQLPKKHEHEPQHQKKWSGG